MRVRPVLAAGVLIISMTAFVSAPCVGDDEETESGAVFAAVNAPFEELLQAAVAEGKPLLILFDAEGCGWCKVLQDEVFVRSDVRAELQKFVVAQYVDGDASATPVIARFHVRGFPTTLVLDGEGAEVDRIPGYEKPDAYLADLRRMLAGEDTLQSLLALGARRSVKQTRTLADKLAYADPTRAVAFCDEALKAREDLTDDDRAMLLLLRAEALANDESPELALETGERLVREYPDTEAAKLASVQLIVALISVPPERALRFLLSAPRPEDPKAQRYLDNHAMILHIRAAAACLERQAEQSGQDAEMLNHVAWDSYRHGLNTEKAIEWARAAVASSDRAPHILDTLAHLLFRDGEIDEAIALENEALERAASDDERRQYEEVLAWFTAVKTARARPTAADER